MDKIVINLRFRYNSSPLFPISWYEKELGVELLCKEKTLRMTPAMEAGLTKKLWLIEDLVRLI